MSDAGEKPFDATPQRLERARSEGNVARAGEAAANASFEMTSVGSVRSFLRAITRPSFRLA